MRVFRFAVSPQALAWGYTGHRIIAEIAEQFLEPETAHQIRDLLVVENLSTLADASTWADQIRVQRPETASWHYVNILVHPAPDEPSGYFAARDCPNDACTVAKIEQFERVLANRQASKRQRLEALKYLVHFVGDMHQPLHASNDHDRGGNDVTVTFMGWQTNLHAVWDIGIIERAVKGNERDYAMQLTRSMMLQDRRYTENYRMPGHSPTAMKRRALPVVNKQLERAGVRLAKILNDCLR